MLKLFCVCALSIAVAGCGLPRDPSGTMDRVERSGTLRLGMVEGAEIDEPSGRTLALLLERTHARPEVTRGDSEELLARLKQGELDLVYGELAMDSPWAKEVAFSKGQGLLGSAPKSEAVPRFAMMNGENGWILAVGEASR